MGIDTTQVRSSRFAGVLLAPTGIFVTYNSSAALMKWRCKSEMRVKALMWSVLCQQRLAGQYRAEDVHGLVLGRQHGTGLPDAHQHRRGQARLFHAGRQLRPFLFSHK